MTTKEQLYHEINQLSEEQMQGLLAFIRGFSKTSDRVEQSLKRQGDRKRSPESYTTGNDFDEMMEELML